MVLGPVALAALAALALGAGCADDSAPATPALPDTGSGESTDLGPADPDADPAGEPDCAAGSLPGPAGRCLPVGPEACDERFRGPDGVCQPSRSDCPGGTIPSLTEGCVPVGVRGCAPEFLDKQGICRVSLDRCPAGTRPDLRRGCVPVGLRDCAPEFLDPEGECRPAADRCPPGTIVASREGCVPVGITDCPAEFRDARGECHPTQDVCPTGSVAVPTLGCLALDGPQGCPGRRWVDPPAGAPVLRVDADAAPDGDGSAARPLASIAAALEAIPDGGTVLVASGTYRENLLLTRPVTLLGVCPSRVILDGPASDGPPVVIVHDAGEVRLEGLQLSGAGTGLQISGESQVLAHGLWFEGCRGAGVVVAGRRASLELELFLLRDTQPIGGDLGFGVSLQQQGLVSLSRGAITHNVSVGAMAMGGSVLDLHDVVVEQTAARPLDRALGYGVSLEEGSQGTLDAVVVARNRGVGVQVLPSGSRLTLRGSVIEQTAPQLLDLVAGFGLAVGPTTTVEAEDSVVSDNRVVGVLVNGGTAQLQHLLVRGTASDSDDGTDGFGLQVRQGGTATLRDSELDDNRNVAVLVSGEGTELHAEGNFLHGTRDSMDGIADRGDSAALYVIAGAKVWLQGDTLADNDCEGLIALGPRTEVELTGCRIADNAYPATLRGGAGLRVLDGPTVTLEDSVVLRNGGMGARVGNAGAVLRARGSLIAHTRPTRAGGEFGLNLSVGAGGQVELDETALVGGHTLGAEVTLPGSSLRGGYNLIADTAPQQADGHHGNLLQATEGGQVTLHDSVLADGARFNVQATEPGTSLALEHCQVGNLRPATAARPGGVGVFVHAGAVATLRRNVLFDQLHLAGVQVQGARSQASLQQNLILGYRDSVDKLGLAHGLGATEGARLTSQGDVLWRTGLVGATSEGRGSRLVGTGMLFDDLVGASGAEEFSSAVLVLDGGELELTDSVLRNASGVGASASRTYTDLGGRLTLIHCLVEQTRATVDRDEWGIGVLAEGGGSVRLQSTLVRRNRTAGVMLYAADAVIRDSLVSSTLDGAFFDRVQGERHEQIGDGVLVLAGSTLDLAGSRIQSNLRAGLLFDHSRGRLVASRSTDNAYGLVTQRSSRVEVDAACHFEPNDEAATWSDGTLAVPQEALPIPGQVGF